MKLPEWAVGLIVALAVILLIVGLAVAITRGAETDARYDAVCKRAGYDEREILSNGRAYCINYWTDYRIVPFETVAAAEEDSR